MKKILLFIGVCIGYLQGSAQTDWNTTRWQQLIEKETPADAKMGSHIYQLAWLATIDKAEAIDRLHHSELRYRAADNHVNIEIVFRNDENIEKITDRINKEYLLGLGFNVDQTWKNRASVWIALDELLPKSKLLSKEYFIFLVTLPRNDNEGPVVINSDSYQAGTAPGGAGKRVAIFDGAFLNMGGAINNGHAKTPAYVGQGGTSTTLSALNYGSGHGTACVETMYDHCPDAVFEIYGNANTTEKGAAVDDCIAHGVDVISMSQSEYNLGWFDNTGAACSYALDAASAGLLFLTSCGNRAESHYEAVFNDDNGNGRHEFVGTNEQNDNLTIFGWSDETHCMLSWNTSAGADYDLFIYRKSDNLLLASSTNTGTGVSGFEYVYWQSTFVNNPTEVYFRVTRKSGNNVSTNFEMFTHDAGDYEFATAAGSNTSPSNTTHLNVISVGAVLLSLYNAADGSTGIIRPYSSQGPTNSGNIAPKLTGPTGTYTYTYGGSFGGTSCATPNLAGAITAFWSAQPSLDATGVRQIMFRMAQLYKDWGTGGNDNVYGYGGLYLYAWGNNLRFMYRTSTNELVTNATRPYYSMAVAQDNAPDNGTVVILNSGPYSETGLYGVSGAGSAKRILYRYPFYGVVASFGY
ncbi:MAG: S8 family serine peptidase [Bacteroidota bacterium]